MNINTLKEQQERSEGVDRLLAALTSYEQADEQALMPLMQSCGLKWPLLESEWREVRNKAEEMGVLGLAKQLVKMREIQPALYTTLMKT